MLKEIANVLTRSRDTIVGDTLGGIALLVVLLAGLHLPGIV